jgi:hypothetical protein
MFEPFTQKVSIKEAEEARLIVNLIPTSAKVQITTDVDAIIYINNEYKAKGPWQGRLNPGIYSVEVRKEHYRTVKQDIEVVVGDSKSVELNPIPIYGSLDIITSPTGVRIKLNEKESGTTPQSFDKLMIGDYKVQLEKDGYLPLTRGITIQEGKKSEINEKMVKGRTAASSKDSLSGGLSADNLDSVKVKKRIYCDQFYRYRGGKVFWLISSLVFAGAGTYAYMESKNYYQDYLAATTDADDLHQKVELFSKVAPAAFGVAGFSFLEFFIKAHKQAKAKKQPLSLHLFNYKNGVGVNLAYYF